MEQFHSLFQSINTPMIYLSFGCVVFMLFSKMPKILKIPAALCMLFVLLLVFYPQELNKNLGGTMQYVALGCFSFAGLAFFVSLFKFFKASVSILSWLLIAFIAGTAAFPDYAKMQLSENKFIENYLSNTKFDGFVSNVKLAFSQTPSSNISNKGSTAQIKPKDTFRPE